MCTPCAVFTTVPTPKGRKEAVGGMLAFFCFGVARRPHLPSLMRATSLEPAPRRIKIAMASACPAAQDWDRAAIRLAALARASPA